MRHLREVEILLCYFQSVLSETKADFDRQGWNLNTINVFFCKWPVEYKGRPDVGVLKIWI